MSLDPLEVRQRSADIGGLTMEKTENPCVPPALPEPRLLSVDGTSCRQHVRFGIFFDGTGNNLDADYPDGGLSNIAKLFRAHPLDNDALNLYRIYVPGIGTYFKEIGDQGTGGLLLGIPSRAFGDMGQARLDWAIERVQEQILSCDRRADTHKGSAVMDIKVAVFGFSRGAATARAFCRDLAKLCPGERYELPITGRKVPIEVNFLGLFDTVASVGLPTSVNKVGSKNANRAPEGDRVPLPTHDQLAANAIGEPGAAPAAGSSNGHYAWGKDIAIGSIVKKCLHLVAAHEWRNSFPLDSVLAGNAYPASTTEMVMPGAHSDVGGGYEPGEGGKSRAPGSLMSLIPLWIMFQEAGKIVPFYRFGDFRDFNRKDFGIDAKSLDNFNAMNASYVKYLAKIDEGTGLGQTILQHNRLYFAWRFRAIARSPAYLQINLADRQAAANRSAARVADLEKAKQLHSAKGWPWTISNESLLRDTREQAHRDQVGLDSAQRNVAEAGEDDADVIKGEAEFAPAREVLRADLNAARKEAFKTQRTADQLEDARRMARRSGATWGPEQEQQLAKARKEAQANDDLRLRALARLDTKANDKALLSNIRQYDNELMEDVRKLDGWLRQDPSLKLRPHYKIILDAYRNEFQRNAGLRDAAIIAFFDHYVHDALSAFASDKTRTSDPRIIYVGQNTRLAYALNGSNPGRDETATA